jgi:hypothetical protein
MKYYYGYDVRPSPGDLMLDMNTSNMDPDEQEELQTMGQQQKVRSRQDVSGCASVDDRHMGALDGFQHRAG